MKEILFAGDYYRESVPLKTEEGELSQIGLIDIYIHPSPSDLKILITPSGEEVFENDNTVSIDLWQALEAGIKWLEMDFTQPESAWLATSSLLEHYSRLCKIKASEIKSK